MFVNKTIFTLEQITERWLKTLFRISDKSTSSLNALN